MDAIELTAQDRCDRCPARAEAVIHLVGGLELFFCSHHVKRYHASLIEQGADISVA